jgi:hypothetical protein
MSWDVLLQKFPQKTARPEEAPDDHLPPAVGSRAEVAAAVRKLFRNAEVASDSFITISCTAFAIEISLGDEEPCSQLLLHVHDDHAAATQGILRLADHFGMRAIDCSSGEFIEAGQGRRRREASTEAQEKKQRSRRKLEQRADRPPPQPPLEYLAGVVTGPCFRVVYLSLLPGESPLRQQKAVFRHWLDLAKAHDGLDAIISGPSFVLTLPGGEPFGDLRVTRYTTKVTETEAEMIPRVQQGAALLHTLAAATGRRCGEIEQGSMFVCDDGMRVPLAQCAYRKLLTDADYARKVQGKKKEGKGDGSLFHE